MRKLRSSSRRGPLGRAATMIEFTLVIPIFLFMMLFSVDMGMLMLTSGAMNDTAFSSARAGAQAGGAGYDTTTHSYACSQNGHCSSGNAASFRTAQDGVEQMPLNESVWTYNAGDFEVESGMTCFNGGPDTFVTVHMPYEMEFFTPGLGRLLGIMDESDGDTFAMTATGVARCELYRVG